MLRQPGDEHFLLRPTAGVSLIVGGRCFDFLTTAPNHYERFFGGIEPEGKTGVLYGAEGKETNRQRRADQEADPAENPHQKLDLSCRSCARSSRQIRRCWAGHDEFIPLRSEEHTSELQSLRHLVCR